MLGIVVEALVAGLLVITIGYCVIVNRKLESLRADKSDLRAIIRDLYAATGHAEKAIGTLRANASGLEKSLGEQVDRAQKAGVRLSHEIDRGDALLSKLAVIAKNNAPRNEAPRVTAARPAPTRAPAAPRPQIQSGRLGLGLLNQPSAGAPESDDLLQPATGKDAA